nr:immunoglobulin light chain junction region [Macaca mulatta]MOW27728.1 immunoglobulin light chain junction region [Macaca mulatta]MOW27942.1 immunoglobulin light chain junction region [Macaca mulatta]MOW27946.1 immunoglobulin light chain junction region [Macaca mulatta]MOW27950.1 immunoglobulin light chain junction region [Macaca mulatta]
DYYCGTWDSSLTTLF